MNFLNFDFESRAKTLAEPAERLELLIFVKCPYELRALQRFLKKRLGFWWLFGEFVQSSRRQIHISSLVRFELHNPKNPLKILCLETLNLRHIVCLECQSKVNSLR